MPTPLIPDIAVFQRKLATLPLVTRPERMHEDFRALAVEAMQKAWPCK
jgi:hypothetical protein